MYEYYKIEVLETDLTQDQNFFITELVTSEAKRYPNANAEHYGKILRRSVQKQFGGTWTCVVVPSGQNWYTSYAHFGCISMRVNTLDILLYKSSP